LVELLGSYSNPDILARLERILAGQNKDRASARTVRSRQTQRRLGPEEVADLVSEYATGRTIGDLATDFGIHRTTVLAHLERQGVKRRSGIITGNLPVATLLYEQGWSLMKIGEHFGVDGETVRQALRKAGVPLRARNGCRQSP
jgi:uncharacterized protein (DUF433 family)